jgi:hypothetical protein
MFHSLAMVPSLWKVLYLHLGLRDNGLSRVAPEDSRALFERCTKLRHLKIAWSTRIDETRWNLVYNAIKKRGSGLTRLEANHVPGNFKDEFFLMLDTFCLNLTELSLPDLSISRQFRKMPRDGIHNF